MDSYVLIVDDETDILEIHEMTVRSTFSGEVRTANSGEEALQVIRENGIPRLIISDLQMENGDGFFLFNSLRESSIQVPFIVCSANPFIQLKALPGNVHIVTKPDIVSPLIKILEKILFTKRTPEFVPVKITHLLRMGQTSHDFYLRLGDENFVRAFKKGENFSASDSEKYIRKSIYNLYISGQEAFEFIKNFEKYLGLKTQSLMQTSEDLVIAYEAVEAVEALSKSLGWAPECVEVARKTVDLALRSITPETRIYEILKLRFNSQAKGYSQHIGKLALMTSAFCRQLDPNSQSSQMKLALASLLHDMTVDPELYENIEEWDEKARDPRDNSELTVRYRNHPKDASALVCQMQNLPPDVDRIIMDHHENSSTSGFPRKIIAGRISHLTALFIVIEDLLHYVGDREPSGQLVLQFIKDREAVYSVGRFKNIFAGLKDSLLESCA